MTAMKVKQLMLVSKEVISTTNMEMGSPTTTTSLFWTTALTQGIATVPPTTTTKCC
jgi:hypothetical protein